jgi:hypothetical protein
MPIREVKSKTHIKSQAKAYHLIMDLIYNCHEENITRNDLYDILKSMRKINTPIEYASLLDRLLQQANLQLFDNSKAVKKLIESHIIAFS